MIPVIIRTKLDVVSRQIPFALKVIVNELFEYVFFHIGFILVIALKCISVLNSVKLWQEFPASFNKIAISDFLDAYAIVGYESPVLKFIHEADIVC